MTNKEKMLSQEYYISWDEELTKEREDAKDLLFEFNQIKPSSRAEHLQIIQKLFGSAGSVVTKDVPEGVLVVGNPARILRKITEKDRVLSDPQGHNQGSCF